MGAGSFRRTWNKIMTSIETLKIYNITSKFKINNYEESQIFNHPVTSLIKIEQGRPFSTDKD